MPDRHAVALQRVAYLKSLAKAAAREVPAPWIDRLCEVMHDAYEEEAQRVGWVTQERSRVPWPDLPYGNKAAMRAGVRALLAAHPAPFAADFDPTFALGLLSIAQDVLQRHAPT